jgi:hypothetical protein
LRRANPIVFRAGAGNPPEYTVMKIIVAVKQVPVRNFGDRFYVPIL